MSILKLKGNDSGTGNVTLEAPNTNTDQTISIPDGAGSFVTANASGDVAVTGAFTSQGIDDNATSVALTLDSSGNLLVGKTTGAAFSTAGVEIDGGNDRIWVTRDNGLPLALNRLSADGDIIGLYRDGSIRGVLGNASTALYITNGATTGIKIGTNAFYATDGNGTNVDNSKDVGTSGVRFDDIYATSGVVNTSDATEKQSIASLTDEEITAAKAISKLFKTYKWNSSVEAKGHAARTHTGVIAQEVEQAMTDAGLDVGNYGFFIRGVWHEDADGNEVEADTEGAVERTRLGIRYPELLSFIGAATEQRLASIEARLDALEAV